MIQLAAHALATLVILFFALFLWARGMAETYEKIAGGITDA